MHMQLGTWKEDIEDIPIRFTRQRRATESREGQLLSFCVQLASQH